MIKRRQFIAGLGGATAWPLGARAQQAAMPLIGFLSSSIEESRIFAALRQGLREEGYIEGRNVEFLDRRAELQYDQLPKLATALVNRRVSVIVAAAAPSAVAAKLATATVPIVFVIGADPAAAAHP